jgi:hypothetical protein
MMPRAHLYKSVPTMHKPIQDTRCLYRSFILRHSLAGGLLIATGLGSSTTQADPADFQAMPGLWKTAVSNINNGRFGQPSIQWHCVNEDADPWLVFANFSVPDAQCQRSDEHRSSTALTWTLSCSGHSPASGRGRVDFDSAEHYTAGIVMKDRGQVVRIEGKRYAACTSPAD